ncbi:hypothetical protein [Streptomyces sp. NPDC058678]|uniref:hypothetical protein n=1 Tax=Streptomyces sp. NPDC058678 TaxID=3346595 RepID=UPI0036576942
MSRATSRSRSPQATGPSFVRSCRLPESRVDASVARLLTEKFRLGLFDERRYVDADVAEEVVGRADFRAAGAATQRRSITVLKDGPVGGEPVVPLTGRGRLYVRNLDPAVAADYADSTRAPRDAIWRCCV